MAKITAIAGVAVLGVLGVAGYRIAHERLAGEVYRQRLHEVAEERDELRERYNRAVRRSAVTELLVDDGSLSVVIRTPEGVLDRVETEVDPAREVYVDYVVKDGRLWIRRVFDDRTAPEDATVIDPSLVDLDWQARSLEHGQAVYRRFEEGRWLVTVTGSGSLGLRRVGDREELALEARPLIEPFEPAEAEADRAIDAISLGDVLRAAVGAKR
jgi:hypothetical protein